MSNKGYWMLVNELTLDYLVRLSNNAPVFSTRQIDALVYDERHRRQMREDASLCRKLDFPVRPVPIADEDARRMSNRAR